MKKKILSAVVLLFIMSLVLSVPVQAAIRVASGDYILGGNIQYAYPTIKYNPSGPYKYFKMKIYSANSAYYSVYNSEYGILLSGYTEGNYKDTYIYFESSSPMYKDVELMLSFSGNGNLIYWIEGSNYYIE